jgi:hypothetical protein
MARASMYERLSDSSFCSSKSTPSFRQSARAEHRRFRPLSAPLAHTQAPYKKTLTVGNAKAA